jgi:hypothetical protein
MQSRCFYAAISGTKPARYQHSILPARLNIDLIKIADLPGYWIILPEVRKADNSSQTGNW